jgi:hypothetical protein
VTYVKRVVLLASSRKPGGRCIAGKEALSTGYGNWIRPVSARPTAEVSPQERRYENGREPAILDVVEIPMLAPAPHGHQTENHRFDCSRRWRKAAALGWADLPALADHPATLWGAGPSTRHGRHDRIALEGARNFDRSLWLIQPEDVTIHTLTKGEVFEKPKQVVRASFRHGFLKYDFPVTDPAVERAMRGKPDGSYPLRHDVYFCVSLTEPHESGYCYKLVATIVSEKSLAAR